MVAILTGCQATHPRSIYRLSIKRLRRDHIDLNNIASLELLLIHHGEKGLEKSRWNHQ